MKQRTHIIFDSIEERTQFNQILVDSKSVDDAIEKVRSQMHIGVLLATSAVDVFWTKRAEFAERYKKS